MKHIKLFEELVYNPDRPLEYDATRELDAIEHEGEIQDFYNYFDEIYKMLDVDWYKATLMMKKLKEKYSSYIFFEAKDREWLDLVKKWIKNLDEKEFKNGIDNLNQKMEQVSMEEITSMLRDFKSKYIVFLSEYNINSEKAEKLNKLWWDLVRKWHEKLKN